MLGPQTVGAKKPWTASGPACAKLPKSPPRSSAPGPPAVVLAPDKHMRSSLAPPHPGHAVEAGTQSATHSTTLPTMSKAPREDTHLGREPVGPTLPTRRSVLQSVVPFSDPCVSGVPVAPTCHSAFVGSRLPALAHASCAWNQVMLAAGVTLATLTAKMSPAQVWPSSVHGA